MRLTLFDVLNKLTDFGYNTNDYRVLTDYLFTAVISDLFTGSLL